MNRDVSKYIGEYIQISNEAGRSADLYARDIYKLWDIATVRGEMDIYKLTGISFEFGFVAGYKTALRLIKAKKKTANRG